MDLGRIYKKLDRIDGKLDSHLERVVRLEEQQVNITGKIKILFSLALAGISAAATAAARWIIGH